MYSQKITPFLAAVKANPELETALDLLRFSELLNDLKGVHDSIQDLLYRRLASISVRPQDTTE